MLELFHRSEQDSVLSHFVDAGLGAKQLDQSVMGAGDLLQFHARVSPRSLTLNIRHFHVWPHSAHSARFFAAQYQWYLCALQRGQRRSILNDFGSVLCGVSMNNMVDNSLENVKGLKYIIPV